LSIEEVRLVYTPVFWIGAAVAWVLSAWTITAVIVEVARGKSRPLSLDVIIGVLFHGGTALLALKLVILASNSG
jgi:hypothetical protein